MTDTHGSTPGNGPVPPTQGDEHAQHAAPMGQQPYYQQQQQYYQQPQHPQHPAGGVTVEKKSHGGRTFLLAFCGAAVACAIGLGGFGIWQATAGGNDSGSSSSATQLGSQNSAASTLPTPSPTRRWQRPSRRRRFPPWPPSMCTRTSPMRAACTVLGPATDLKPAR